jgi:hypothetical protein
MLSTLMVIGSVSLSIGLGLLLAKGVLSLLLALVPTVGRIGAPPHA